VVATSGREPDGAYGPGNKDYITVTLSKIVDEPYIGNQSSLDRVLEFVPALTDVNYTGCVPFVVVAVCVQQSM
jgi:hypothetical protein